MIRDNGILKFVPSTIVNVIPQSFTDKKYVPSNQLLFFTAYYRLGKLFTDLGNEVLALKYLENSIDIKLIEPIYGTQEAKPIIDEHPHTILLDYLKMPHVEIIPEYNCHGLCFSDSLYRMPDVTRILADEYFECEQSEAYCGVYFEKNITVHSVLKSNGRYLSKAGIRGIHVFNTVEQAIAEDINYDRFSFYKPKESPAFLSFEIEDVSCVTGTQRDKRQYD